MHEVRTRALHQSMPLQLRAWSDMPFAATLFSHLTSYFCCRFRRNILNRGHTYINTKQLCSLGTCDMRPPARHFSTLSSSFLSYAGSQCSQCSDGIGSCQWTLSALYRPCMNYCLLQSSTRHKLPLQSSTRHCDYTAVFLGILQCSAPFVCNPSAS